MQLPRVSSNPDDYLIANHGDLDFPVQYGIGFRSIWLFSLMAGPPDPQNFRKLIDLNNRETFDHHSTAYFLIDFDWFLLFANLDLLDCVRISSSSFTLTSIDCWPCYFKLIDHISYHANSWYRIDNTTQRSCFHFKTPNHNYFFGKGENHFDLVNTNG